MRRAPLAVALHRVRLPLHRPHVAAHGTEDRREVVLVAVTDGAGTTGWGECPTLARPGYGTEWTDGAWAVLVSDVGPALAAGEEVGPRPEAPMAAGAVRDALLDLDLRRRGAGPAAVLGPLAPSVAFGVAIGLADDEGAVVAAAARAAEAGAALVVLKVRPGWSAAPVRAVRAALPELAVAVDANGSFGLGDLDELRAVDAAGPAFVEQPAADLATCAALTAALGAPVALDEGVATEEELDAAVALGAGSVLTVKAARAGGVERAAALARRAAAAGWAVHAGGMLESGLGRAAARVVAALPEVAGPALVGPTALLFAADVVDPVPAVDGWLPVPAGPGLAPPPDPDRLAALTVDRWELRP